MKKILLSFALASTMLAANAQDMMSKKGTPILPEAGDWSIGFDANWLLNYAGNFINHNVNNFNGVTPQQDMTLVGLYVKDAETAYRAKLRIGLGSTTNDATPPFDSTKTPQEVKSTNLNVTLGFGIQKSRGKGRLHGIYGAQVEVGFGSAADVKNSYSLALSSTNTNGGADRTTEDKGGSIFNLGLNGFIGAEYFFAPKMSFSAEYGWGLILNSNGTHDVTNEHWDSTGAGAVVTTTTSGGKNSTFSLDVMNASSVVFHLYF